MYDINIVNSYLCIEDLQNAACRMQIFPHLDPWNHAKEHLILGPVVTKLLMSLVIWRHALYTYIPPLKQK
jgi:hypothetical protein